MNTASLRPPSTLQPKSRKNDFIASPSMREARGQSYSRTSGEVSRENPALL